MTDKDKPAFPHASTACGSQLGMTLRDYFAARSISVILPLYTDTFGNCDLNQVAIATYELADAMMEARK